MRSESAELLQRNSVAASQLGSVAARAVARFQIKYFAACSWHLSACEARQALLEQICRPFNQVACTRGYFKISPAILVFNLKLSTATFVKSLTLVLSNPVFRANIQ